MFELLDDPAPPVPTPADRQRVLRAGRAHLARRRLATGGLATAGLLTVGLVALALAASGDRPSTVDAVDAPTSTSTSSTTTTTTSVEAASPEDAPTTTTAKATTATSTPTSTQPPTTTTTAAPPRVEPKATRDGRPSVPPRPGVRLTLHLERTSIAAGDTFAGTLTVVNNSSEDVSIGPNACDCHHHGLYRDGDWVGGEPSRTCPAVVDPVIVAPGESYQFSLTFEGRGYDPHAYEQPPLPAGVYQAAAGVYGDAQEGEPRQAWFTPSVDVEIR